MPAVETTGVIQGPKRTYQAGVAAMGRGLAVIQGADDHHVIPSTANASAFGIIEESTVNANDAISIVRSGEAVAVAGAAITAGTQLISDGTGRLIPTAADMDNIVARAVSSATAAGDYLVVFINPFVK